MFPKYDPAELTIVSYNPPLRCGDTLRTPVFNCPITPRENLQKLFQGEKPCWMPIVGMRGYDIHVFRPRMFPDNYATHLVYDAEPQIQYDSMIQTGWYDLQWQFVPAAMGATVRPGKPKVPSMVNWEDYISIPDVDELDWERSAEINKPFLATNNMRQLAMLTCLWERLMSLLDVENAAIALVDEEEQEGVHRYFDALCNQYDRIIELAVKYYDIDMVLWHDDWGTQRAPFFSAQTHREMILPYIKRIVESCHKRGLRFELHSCGNNEVLVPNMIEAGVDLWCGQAVNDFDKLAHQYRDAPIVFGIPCPTFAPGTDKETIWKTAADLLEQYDGCKVAVNCLFAYPDEKFGRAIYELSRKKYEA